jgi:acetamidase/formamidase
MPTHHELWPVPSNVQWGQFSASQRPVLTVESGDTVTVHTLSGAETDQPPVETGLRPMPEQESVFREVERGAGPHVLVGPIAVGGAEPGDAITVEILDMRLRADWGFTRISPGRGSLPAEYPVERRLLIALDRVRNVARLPWGAEIPTRPFFGIVGTSPPASLGVVNSIIPGAFGGNMDVKELQPGTVLHLPVFVPGALLMIGDGHAAQGNGEVCVTAVETALSGSIRIGLLKNAQLEWPWIETPEHLISLGFHEDLDEAALIALRSMIKLIGDRTTLAAADAYMLCSLAADFHVSQMVNVRKGIHATLEKKLLETPAVRPTSRHESLFRYQRPAPP